MKFNPRVRSLTALLMTFVLLLTPAAGLAKKGEKNYNRGLKYEEQQQWDKAAQEFALALAANPSDTEYQLHYQRSLFNASQMYMQRGRALVEQGDFTGAYNAFRQAYGYDPVNELAASEMRRMLRLQREKQGLPPEPEDEGANVNGASNTSTPASLRASGANGGVNGQRPSTALPVQEPNPRYEQLKVINYSGELEPLIRRLSDELDLNVVFDRDFSQQVGKRQVTYNFRNMTTARALDYIFMAQGLFFQKLDRRTILVADQSKRPQYQELVLRTFYLFNIKPEEARTLIQTALPANAGRQPTVTLNAATNSITVRDTQENIRLIGELLKSVDKDRAEVVMEVSIYEVSRNDLLRIGNQIGSETSLTQLGGTGPGVISIGNRRAVTGPLNISPPLALGAAILLPASAISLFQSKSNTRLVFSTQVHAFDSEKSETRIGQKVPVQTASVTPFGFGAGTQTGTGTGTGTSAGVFSGGFPVIQYEDTGLSLDFTPKVYPNQDVEVKMVIDTKDAVITTNALTPTFTQRRVTGIARVPNNRTIMIASIAQDRQSDGRQGLPLVGLIPVLGRLFTTPRRDNSESDVVMTLTPRVLRAPSITPADEESRPTGSIQTPRSESLEALVRDADRDDRLAAARQLPTNRVVQLPAPAPETLAAATNPATPAAANVNGTTNNAAAQHAANTTAAANVPNAAAAPAEAVTFVPAPNILADTTKPPAAARQANAPAPTNVAAFNAPAPSAVEHRTDALPAANAGAQPAALTVSGAELRLVPEAGETRVGARTRLTLALKTDAPLGLTAATMRFDPRLLAVRSVTKGGLFGASAPSVTHSVDPTGVLVVSVAPAAGARPFTGEGALLVIEVEALGAGDAAFNFDPGQVHFIATDGRSLVAQAVNAQLRLVP